MYYSKQTKSHLVQNIFGFDFVESTNTNGGVFYYRNIYLKKDVANFKKNSKFYGAVLDINTSRLEIYLDQNDEEPAIRANLSMKIETIF